MLNTSEKQISPFPSSLSNFLLSHNLANIVFWIRDVNDNYHRVKCTRMRNHVTGTKSIPTTTTTSLPSTVNMQTTNMTGKYVNISFGLNVGFQNICFRA